MPRNYIVAGLKYLCLLAAILFGFRMYKAHHKVVIDAADQSMQPDYPNGTYTLNVEALRASEIPADSVVAFHPVGKPDEQFVAWVLAGEGQRIGGRDRKFQVDGQPCKRQPNTRLNLIEVRVPRGCLFVMANIPEEVPQRYGIVPMRNVTGRLK